jgi:hypothetical protein
MTDSEGGPRTIEVEDHRMEVLMTYTVFHIGLYMSLNRRPHRRRLNVLVRSLVY